MSAAMMLMVACCCKSCPARPQILAEFTGIVNCFGTDPNFNGLFTIPLFFDDPAFALYLLVTTVSGFEVGVQVQVDKVSCIAQVLYVMDETLLVFSAQVLAVPGTGSNTLNCILPATLVRGTLGTVYLSYE